MEASQINPELQGSSRTLIKLSHYPESLDVTKVTTKKVDTKFGKDVTLYEIDALEGEFATFSKKVGEFLLSNKSENSVQNLLPYSEDGALTIYFGVEKANSDRDTLSANIFPY